MYINTGKMPKVAILLLLIIVIAILLAIRVQPGSKKRIDDYNEGISYL